MSNFFSFIVFSPSLVPVRQSGEGIPVYLFLGGINPAELAGRDSPPLGNLLHFPAFGLGGYGKFGAHLSSLSSTSE
jgi:hypothetical protein